MLYREKQVGNITISKFGPVMICVFLGLSNFYGFDFELLLFSFFIFLVPFRGKIRVNASLVFLLLFACFSAIFEYDPASSLALLLKPFVYPICYFLGMNIFRETGNSKEELFRCEKRFGAIITIVSSGLVFHFLLNMIANRSTVDASRGELIDFWTGKATSATGQAALASMMVGLSIAYLVSKSEKKKKLFALASLFLIAYYNLVLAGRTLYLLMLILFAVAGMHYGIKKKRFLRVLLLIFLVLTLCAILYKANAFGLQTTIKQSNFYYRFFGEFSQGFDEDSRLETKLQYLQHMIEYPWGRGRIRDVVGHHAHDLYLDTYSSAGVLAFLPLVVYILISLGRACSVIKEDRISFASRQVILCLYVVLNLQFWLEPILQGVPWLFSAYCFFDGAVSYLIVCAKKGKKQNRGSCGGCELQ